MIKESLVNALSDQVNTEYYSAYLYLSMSAYADRAGFKGVAHWLFVQAQEEIAHGTHLYRHILDRGAAPSFGDIKTPQSSFASIKDLFDKILAHERQVTERIHRIASLAQSEQDHATYAFISWYINEQVEEEAQAEELAARAARIGDNPGLLYNLDSALAARTFTDPFAGEGA
ncbi:MAG: ferritin [Spirochaetaceae bacterium]|jgi:ferritin|nr:ferritin [Spirochaetaceae bacterium]